MGVRRKGRETAFQLLYQLDMSKASFETVKEDFWSQMSVPIDAREFCDALVEGALTNLEKIDELISSHSYNWKISRMNSVDKNVIRLGVYELLFCSDTPTKVIINEAIEIGKKYGTEESGSFINGILDRIAKEVRE